MVQASQSDREEGEVRAAKTLAPCGRSQLAVDKSVVSNARHGPKRRPCQLPTSSDASKGREIADKQNDEKRLLA